MLTQPYQKVATKSQRFVPFHSGCLQLLATGKIRWWWITRAFLYISLKKKKYALMQAFTCVKNYERHGLNARHNVTRNSKR
jgi:hypothetical protein